ncbi:hypothetical protein [Streptomyces aidingensis]|uniref:hypothetical protein n=1 Tax=Streptomyces aidingensis TaxID=910347 RepID=UPI001587C292|nr:hypothetical protein [Streptomyces aidingensis]
MGAERGSCAAQLAGWDRHGNQPPPPLPGEVVAHTRVRCTEAYRLLTGLPWD